MKKIKNYIAVGVIAAFLSVLGMSVIKINIGTETAQAEIGSRSCKVVSSSIVNIGHQLFTEVMATTSNRAYARIQVPDNATNTVRLMFGGDVSAINGITLNVPNLNGASSTPFVEFGLNTSFPFVGMVTALTDNGSSTINVINCLYN